MTRIITLLLLLILPLTSSSCVVGWGGSWGSSDPGGETIYPYDAGGDDSVYGNVG